MVVGAMILQTSRWTLLLPILCRNVCKNTLVDFFIALLSNRKLIKMRLVENLIDEYPLWKTLIYLDADIQINKKSLANIVGTFEYIIFRNYYESELEKGLVHSAKEEYSIVELSLSEKFNLIKEFLQFFFEDDIEKALDY